MQTDPESIKTVIADYLFKYLEHFRYNLDNAIAHYDPESIHEYRVAVKRIRAVINSLDKIYDDPLFPDDVILPLRKMFKAGGTIRDDQVQIELVEKVEKEYHISLPLIKAYYLKRIEDQRNSFFLKSVDFDFEVISEIKEQIENILDPLDAEYLEYNLNRRINESMARLKRKRYDLDQPEALHRFRTKYKENGYITEMLYHSRHSQKISKATYTRIKNFGQELGNWHDHYQLWSKTAVIFKESKSTDLLGESFELRKLITPVHDKLFQEILHLIKRDDSLFAI
jgi:CHAD domain-containing protein